MLFKKGEYKYFFKNQLSWYFVPILLFIWYVFPNYNYIFANTIACVGIIGIIETIFYERDLGFITRIISIIFHLLILIPFIPAKYYSNKRIDIDTIFPKNPYKMVNLDKNINKKSVSFNLEKNRFFYKKDLKYLTEFNIYNFAIYTISIIVILNLPYWPYYMSRSIMALYITIITLSLWINSFI